MNALRAKLKSVPAITVQELLSFLAEQEQDTVVRIVTSSGQAYMGTILNAGTTRDGSTVMTLQLFNTQHGLTDCVLHVPAHQVESVELLNDKDAILALSLGRVFKNEVYESSGKLEIKREFQLFSEALSKNYGLPVEVSHTNLPEDGFALNRIVKLTKTIRQAIVDLLKEEDARASWQKNFQKILFFNGERLDVKGVDNSLQIYFPFADVNQPEILPRELTAKVMSVL